MSGFGPSRIVGGALGPPPLNLTLLSQRCALCYSASYTGELTTLSCGHIFCNRCLNQRADANLLNCPTCNTRIDLGDHGVEGLTDNYLFSDSILNVINSPDDVKSAPPAAFPSQWTTTTTSSTPTTTEYLPPTPGSAIATRITCQSCHENMPVSKHCMECAESLCQNCVSAHQRVTLTSEHMLVSLPAVSLSSVSVVQSHGSSHRQHCSKHPTETIGFCCESCIQPLCNDCILMGHRGHKISRIQDAASTIKLELPAIKAELTTAGEAVTRLVSQMDHMTENIDNRVGTVTSEIRTYIRRYMTALEEKERELLKQVDDIRKLKLEVIRDQKKELMSVKGCLKEALSLAFSTDQVNQPSELVYMKKDLYLMRNKIQADLGRLQLCQEDDQIDFSQRELDLRTAISQAGVLSSNISSVHTTASGQGIHCCIVGKPAKFLVTGRNHSNHLVASASLDSVKVTVFSPDGNQVVVNRARKRESVLQFSYLPSVGGIYTVWIQVRGRHIPGSPSQAKVRKRRNYYNIGTAHHTIGSAGKLENEFCRPWGVCCDPTGHVIVADRSNNRIQVFNPNGSFNHTFGEEGKEPGQFNRPAGVAVNSRNQIIVTDKDNHRVQMFTFEGQFVRMFGDRGSADGQLQYPWDVACNNEDQILVSDTRNYRIQLFSPEGVYLSKYNFQLAQHQRVQPQQPRGVCFTDSGDIWVTDFNKHRLMFIKVTQRELNIQSMVQVFGNEGKGNSQFCRPQGVAVDLEGNILVTEGRNHRVQIFRPDGAFLTKFGTVGCSDTELDTPSGICVTPDGYIVVVDMGNDRIMFF